MIAYDMNKNKETCHIVSINELYHYFKVFKITSLNPTPPC